MSELIEQKNNRVATKWHLLASVSALALIANTVAPSSASADDADRPTVWIELGGQLERVDGGQKPFAPPFVANVDTSVFTSPIEAQRPPRYATGADAHLSIQPKGSDWTFSAGIRFGRSNGKKKLHQEAPLQTLHKYYSVPLLGVQGTGTATAAARQYSDNNHRHDENHAILDFMAGKDVGLGLFGHGGTSIISAGVRFAQFSSKYAAAIGANPDFHVSYKYASVLPPPLPPFSGYFKIPQQHWHQYRANADISRSFHGIGPTISWNASAPVAGTADRMELTFDWGVNAAVLFGRQKVIAHHETDGSYHYPGVGLQMSTVIVPHQSHSTARSRSVAVPNVGGFAGFSLKFPNAKISLGYRVDAFFGAMDGGIDTRKTYDRDFYGPFATISIGLGG